jgi:hypothetical protein
MGALRLRLMTQVRRNMRERLLDYTNKLRLRKRALIESVHDQLRNICQSAHNRHRSPFNFLVHLFAGLTAYSHQPMKPARHLSRDLLALPVM